MHPRERLAYSPIEGRKPLKLPDGLRLIVWPVLALEEWDMARPMARMVISPPQGQPMQPDHPNWSWHEYGMRVGFWRMKRMLDALKISPTVTLNARVCETYPQVAQACVDAGWELNAHGYDQVPMHKLDDQKAVIDKSVAIIAKFWGKAPRGWGAARVWQLGMARRFWSGTRVQRRKHEAAYFRQRHRGNHAVRAPCRPRAGLAEPARAFHRASCGPPRTGFHRAAGRRSPL